MKRVWFAASVCAVLLLFAVPVSAATAVSVSCVAVTEESTAVTVTVAQSGNYQFVCASYHTSGAMLDAKIQTASVTAGTPTELTFSGLTNSEDIRLYVLNADFSAVCIAKQLYGSDVIHLNGTSIDTGIVEGVTVNGTALTITAPGTYRITGQLDNGSITVSDDLEKDDEVTICLLGTNVTSADSAPFNAGNAKVTVTLEEGTENVFTDTAEYTAYSTKKEPKGCFYSKRDLTIQGSGKLTVNGNVKNGLVCGADLEIGGGASVSVTAVDNAIKGNGSVKITKKAGTVYACSAEGDALKTDAIETDDDDETICYIEEGKGTVTINGGTVTLIATTGDGIQADRSVTMKGGTVTVTAGADAVKANESNIPEAEDFDGIETATVFVSGSIAISGGTLKATAGEDGIKACESITVSGGTVNVTSANDALQSDGTLTVSDGTVTVKTGSGHTEALEDDSEISAKGLKADSLLSVTGGSITVDSADDALHSDYSVSVTGGTLQLASGDDGIHADYRLTLGTEDGGNDDFTVRITDSYEGVEGSVIDFLSGTTVICASDDGINAAGSYLEDGTVYSESSGSGTGSGGQPGSPSDFGRQDDSAPCGMLYLRGGMVYVCADGDGLDSNGSIAMSGGTVLVDAPKDGGNGVFDYGEGQSNSFQVTGGTLIGIGLKSMTVNISLSGQSCIENSYNKTATTTVSFSASGTVYTVTPSKAWNYIYITAPGLEKTSFKNSATAGSTQVLGMEKNNVFYGLCRQSA